MGVLRTFQLESDLFENNADMVELCEIASVTNVTQANTERTVKTIANVVDGRYEGKFDETMLDDKTKRDRVEEEVIVKKSGIPLEKLPLKKLRERFFKKHLPAVQKDATKISSTLKSHINQPPKYAFF